MSLIGIIGLGGILGTLARFYLGKWILSKTGIQFPWGTLTINLTGSFILGILFYWHIQDLIPLWVWSMLGIGFCGAYTTFSTFGYETSQLLGKKKLLRAIMYTITSVSLGLLCAWLGILLVS